MTAQREPGVGSSLILGFSVKASKWLKVPNPPWNLYFRISEATMYMAGHSISKRVTSVDRVSPERKLV